MSHFNINCSGNRIRFAKTEVIFGNPVKINYYITHVHTTNNLKSEACSKQKFQTILTRQWYQHKGFHVISQNDTSKDLNNAPNEFILRKSL